MGAHRFWILGGGRFGRLAVQRIGRRIPDATMVVVDHNPLGIGGPGITVHREEGLGWLFAELHRQSPVDWIVPAIPVHVAAGWIARHLQQRFTVTPLALPDAWLAGLPHPIRGKTGQVFLSHADFICPDNCPEPEAHCTHTGQPRPEDLFSLLAQVDVGGLRPIVLRSHQLLPGLGGLRPGELFAALDLACGSGHHHPLMIATACRCHGVLDAVVVKARAGCGEAPFP